MRRTKREPIPYEAAIQRLQDVLAEHGYTENAFTYNTEGFPAYITDFAFCDQTHTIAIYENDILMYAGNQLFECYMREEYKSNSKLIDGFATRLDRYLSGGPWEGPDEKSLPDAIKEKAQELFKLLRRKHQD